MKSSCDCIIPFYNEGERILSVIDALSRVPSINKIICVDDGSTDYASEKLTKKFPNIILVRLNNNSGKSNAVFAGLRKVTSDSVLLFDGDLVNVRPLEIELACKNYFHLRLDMLILKAHGQKRYVFMDNFFRNYIIQSGNRITKINDLQEVEKFHPVGYQIEVAINQYMMEKKKNCAWQRISAVNIHKSSKLSFFEGWTQDVKMEAQIISYAGLFNVLNQILFFCRQKIV